MKKNGRIILSVVGLIVILLLLDTIQAKVFNNSPLLKIRSNKDGGLVDYIDKGLLVNHFVCTDKTSKTSFKGKKYDCSDSIRVKEIVDTSNDIKDFACDEVLDEFYDDGDYKYSYSCSKSKYVVVRYANGFEETVEDALKNGKITMADVDRYGISYTKEAKVSDVNCLQSLLGGYITTEKVTAKEVKLKNIISVSLKKVDYSYAAKDSLGIYVILKTSDTKVVDALEKYLDKNYKGYEKVTTNDGYLIYVQNTTNDFDLANEVISCYK